MESMEVQETAADQLMRRFSGVTVIIAKAETIDCSSKVMIKVSLLNALYFIDVPVLRLYQMLYNLVIL